MMKEIEKTKDEFYNNQSKQQLITFLHNYGYIEEGLTERLHLLTGCGDFGNSDGTNGSCVECCYNNPDLFKRCELFSKVWQSYKVQKFYDKQSNKEG